MSSVLIVCDVQNCFMKHMEKDLSLAIKTHVFETSYDFIAFSKFRNNISTNFTKKLGLDSSKPEEELSITPELLEIADDKYVFEKDTYSILKSKEFAKFLKDNEIDQLYFCGVDIDACILASLFEAFDLGYDFEVLDDLVSSSGSERVSHSAFEVINRNLR